MSDIVPRSQVAKQGIHGFLAVAGGIGTLVLASIGGIGGILIGGVLTVVGLAFARGTKAERGAGVATAIVGAAVLVSSIPVLGPLGGMFHWIMRAGGILLLGFGGFSLFRFFKNLRKRM
jgi:hypothetical protein